MSKRTFEQMSTEGKPASFPPMFSSLLESGLYSDLTIKCQDQTWKVHRVVVCLQSKPLAAALHEGFPEAEAGLIDLVYHDPEIVGYMISFMYSGNYNISKTVIKEESTVAVESAESTSSTEPTDTKLDEETPDTSRELITHTEVYLIAEEKDIPALKELAVKKYEKVLPKTWNSEAFVTSLKMMYEGTPESDRGLKDVAIKVAGKHLKTLVDRGEFVAVWKERGEIGLDVFRAFMASEATNSPSASVPVLAPNPSPVSRPFGGFSLFTSTHTSRYSPDTDTGGQCPNYGSAHAMYVIVGYKGDNYYCRECREGFD